MSTIHAPQYEPSERASRAPIDLIAVIDRSGSMRGKKLDLVKETLRFVISQLKADDCFSIVSYDTNVTTNLPLCKLDAQNKVVREFLQL